MDTISHGLWSHFIFRQQKCWWLAPLLGVLPDLIASGPHFIFEHFQGEQALFDRLYCYTHSLVIWGVAMVIVSVCLRRVFWVGCAWALHVIVDVFTHPLDYYPTPYLYPFDSPYLGAVDYRSVGFLLTNFALMFVTILLWWRYRSKRLPGVSGGNAD